MLLAEKSNRRVRIADEKKDEYIGMGYTVKNMDGSLVKAPNDPKKQVKDLKTENAALKEKLEEATAYAENADKRIAELQEKLEELQKPSKTSGTKKADAANKASDVGNKAGEKARSDK